MNLKENILSVSERKLVQSSIFCIRNSSSSIDELQSAISQLRNIRDNQIKSEIVKEEI